MSKKPGKDAARDEDKTTPSPGYSHEPDHSALPGTNKTVATPKPDGAESEELDNNMTTVHIEKSPYTRG